MMVLSALIRALLSALIKMSQHRSERRSSGGDWSHVLRAVVLCLVSSMVANGRAQEVASSSHTSSAPRPHIVIILLDDLGYGDLGSYNADSKIPTPSLDDIAEQGIRFTDAHAPGPLCHLSRYGLMTGRYPFRANVGAWSRQPVIEADRLTLPQMLQHEGYQTRMVGKWHLGFSEPDYVGPLLGGPCDRGFDSFFGIRASTDIPPYFWIRDRLAVEPPTEPIEANHTEGWTDIQGRFWRQGKIAPHMTLDNVLPRMAEESIALIRQHAQLKNEKPLFLYIALPAPHTPWLPSSEFSRHGGAGLYGEFVGMVDDAVGQIDRALADNNMLQDTLLIVTSDNGPVWYPQDQDRFQHDSSGGLRGMKADAWEAGHRMPFLVRWPGRIAAGSRSDQLVCFTDVFATCAELLGVTLKEHDAPDSISFLSILDGTPAQSTQLRQEIVMRSGGGLRMIRRGRWKLIDGLGSGGFSSPRKVTPADDDPQGQLFDLHRDPGEQQNRYQDEPEIVASLQAALEQAFELKSSRE